MSVLLDFKDILLSVTDKVYHFEPPQSEAPPYIVWQETGGYFSYGGNADAEKVTDVQVNVYSEDEFEPLVDAILAALREQEGIAYDYPVVDYDDDLKLIRTIIECEVC